MTSYICALFKEIDIPEGGHVAGVSWVPEQQLGELAISIQSILSEYSGAALDITYLGCRLDLPHKSSYSQLERRLNQEDLSIGWDLIKRVYQRRERLKRMLTVWIQINKAVSHRTSFVIIDPHR